MGMVSDKARAIRSNPTGQEGNMGKAKVVKNPPPQVPQVGADTFLASQARPKQPVKGSVSI